LPTSSISGQPINSGQNDGPVAACTFAHASASARLATSHSATSRDPHAEYLNGQSRSGRMLPFRVPSRSSATSARRLQVSHSDRWGYNCSKRRGRCRGYDLQRIATNCSPHDWTFSDPPPIHVAEEIVSNRRTEAGCSGERILHQPSAAYVDPLHHRAALICDAPCHFTRRRRGSHFLQRLFPFQREHQRRPQRSGQGSEFPCGGGALEKRNPLFFVFCRVRTQATKNAKLSCNAGQSL
jgi:hypothetical protein